VIAALVMAGCSVPPPGNPSAPTYPSTPTYPGGRLDPSAVDDAVLVTLVGNTNPQAIPANSVGRLPDEFLIENMQLVLKRAPELEATLAAHIDALHDKTSPQYQQWLTAQDFGDQYGVAMADIAIVTAWLQKHGFTIDTVPPSRMFIEFTGTAGQISGAFHTEIDQLLVKGVPHIGNMSDPQIPVALAPVVAGVHALHDFMPRPMYRSQGMVKRDGATGAWSSAGASPDFDIPLSGCLQDSDCNVGGVSVGATCNTATGQCNCTMNSQCNPPSSGAFPATCGAAKTCVRCNSNADCVGPRTCNLATNVCQQTFHAVAPADFATIYNLNPLFAAGITGSGQTIAVIEDNVLANTGDVATFRNAFGLAGYKGTFKQFQATGTAATCRAPGVNAAEGEAALDAEWAGATAPDAAIELAACRDTITTFGGLIALQNLLTNATPPQAVSISYGECESANGNAANQSYVNTYQQAAAQGVSVFVSSGDQGATVCDGNATSAAQGISVSGFASTPYNIAVGGTDFMDYVSSTRGGPAVSSYWAASNSATFGSAQSYIPEIPWNDSCSSQMIYSTPTVALGTYTQGYGAGGFCNSTLGKARFQTNGAGSGGPSTFSAQPSWQTGVIGLPAKSGGMRSLPDVSLFSASGVFGHFLVFCMTDTAQQGGPCVYTSTADTLALAAGGTSFAAPSLAGIQALINQKMVSASNPTGKQGNPNYTYYKLAAAEQGVRGSTRCNASLTTLPHAECIFNDITQGDIVVNCTGTNCFGATGGNQGSLSTSTTAFAPAYAAGTGWDFATGLGTVNAFNLVNAWSQ
jgi:subtilase family serine protease